VCLKKIKNKREKMREEKRREGRGGGDFSLKNPRPKNTK